MIREAAERDVEAVVALINTAFIIERFFIDGDRTSAGEVRRLLGKGRFLVREAAGATLDACVYVEPRDHRAYLGLLALAPDLQGQGVGRMMLDAAEDWCRARGCRTIDIRVVSVRTELFPIYEKRGFVRRGTSPLPSEHAPKIACHFVDMSKDL